MHRVLAHIDKQLDQPLDLETLASFKGTVADIEAAWIAMLRDWLPSSGLQLDGRVMFEYYPEGSSYDPATGIFDCKLCVPVVPL